MAKQKGAHKLQGSIGDLSYYRTKHGYISREKSAVPRDRILTAPEFVRTRENMKEFGGIMHSGKLLRDSISTLLAVSGDKEVTTRVTRLMAAIKRLDVTSQRGRRNVAAGLQVPDAVALVTGFEFNHAALLKQKLTAPIMLTPSDGSISIEHFVPVNHLAAPYEATHVRLLGTWVRIDFAEDVSETVYTNELILPIDVTPTDVLLEPLSVPTGTGTDLFFLQVSFIQAIGQSQYNLRSDNALAIIGMG